ncbi:collagen-like protein [Arenibacter sp. F26102]|uniref:collagen-like protein n=1 Tax=Arenibacter sp. F26102 TaxID=2926416 RepID=UPI001FF14BB4|nr:collagen-like protein [Arenibacter sp. F26102]MCK0145006.1 collagen-like protein [Arenibacter sp. F26102]
MKNVISLLGAFIALFFISCEGPAGPPGFDGLDGLDGLDGQDGIQGQVFEVDNVNFNYDAGGDIYSYIITFSDFTSFAVFESDAVLVYRYDGTVDYQDNTSADAWSLIPQNFFLPEGTIQYTNAHTFIDVEIFIDGNFDLANLNPDFTDNQLFRIVILPSQFAESKLDKSNINAVMKAIDVEEKDVLRFKSN